LKVIQQKEPVECRVSENLCRISYGDTIKIHWNTRCSCVL